MVEHDEDTIRAADYIIDLGPGAGPRGGQIVAAGDIAAIEGNPDSLTGQYLARALRIPIPRERVRPRAILYNGGIPPDPGTE